MARVINANTKAGQRFISAFDSAAEKGCTELWEVYGTYSAAKARGLEYCREKAYREHALTPVYIISATTFVFTCGWLVENPVTGVVEYHIETAQNSYVIS